MGDGALSAMFLSGLTPRRVAIAHRHTPLWKAYLIHWLCLIIGTLILLVLLVLDKDPGFLVRDLRSFVQPFTLTSAAVCAIIVLVIEAGFGLSALMLLPWGDAKAPVRPLCRQALRTVWLHTGHLVLAGTVYGSLQVMCDNLLRPEWWHPHIVVDPPQSRATLTLLKWLYENDIYLLVIAFAAVAIWCLWALLRAMTTSLPPAETSRPPLCEACGYNLSHHDISARCPECGRPVVQSLGDGLRSIVPWGPYRSKAKRTGFWRVTFDAWFRPETFFMGVSVLHGLGSAGRFLLNHMLLTAAGFVAAIIGADLALFRETGTLAPTEIYGMTCFGAVVGFVFGCAASLVAAVVGLVVSKQDGRNCVGGALRLACFCAGIFPFWVFSLVATVAVVIKIIESRGPGAWRFYSIIPIAMLALVALLAILYTGGVARRVRYVRYANS